MEKLAKKEVPISEVAAYINFCSTFQRCFQRGNIHVHICHTRQTKRNKKQTSSHKANLDKYLQQSKLHLFKLKE